MALVKEDGTGVIGANTYAVDSDLVAYAALRGITLPATAGAREALLIKAMDYIESLGPRYMGSPFLGLAQVLQWPRNDVYFYGILYATNKIPYELVQAQLVLAIAAQTVELLPIATGKQRSTTLEKVGPIEIQYSAAGAEQSLLPFIPQASSLLRALFGSSGQMKVVRA